VGGGGRIRGQEPVKHNPTGESRRTSNRVSKPRYGGSETVSKTYVGKGRGGGGDSKQMEFHCGGK